MSINIGMVATYIVAAVGPAVALMLFVYQHDKIEKEPIGMLARLALFGALSAILAGIIEGIGMGALDALLAPGSAVYIIFLAFLVIAVTEEGVKYIFLKKISWRSPYFNFRFDAIVYAVFVSLGFAALENVMYIVGYGLSVAPARALLAIPGHMSFAVFMGYYYGRARLAANYGDQAGSRRNQWLAYIIAVLLHGFYDTCAMIGTGIAVMVFLAFVIAMFIIVFVTLRKESKEDVEIQNYNQPPNMW